MGSANRLPLRRLASRHPTANALPREAQDQADDDATVARSASDHTRSRAVVVIGFRRRMFAPLARELQSAYLMPGIALQAADTPGDQCAAGWIVVATPSLRWSVAEVRKARQLWPLTPALVVNVPGRTAVPCCLLAGADDALWIGQPEAERAARLTCFARRVASAGEGSRLIIGDLALDLTHQQLFCAGRRIRATPRQFRILECLAQNAGSIVSAYQLRDFQWAYRSESRPGINAVEVCISALRRLLHGHESRVTIRTHRGRGYELAG